MRYVGNYVLFIYPYVSRMKINKINLYWIQEMYIIINNDI